MKSIPLIDIRSSGPVALVQEYEHLAKALLQSARTSFGKAGEIASYAAYPVGDFLSRRWLQKSGNPYLKDIAYIAKIIDEPGVFALNLSYEWGCTTSIQGCKMLRTLDWPFKGMGSHMVIAHEEGPAGDFYNITWPGLVGVFTALAPGRFAVAINQAPMLERTGNLPTDWLLNRMALYHQNGLPPSHVLRYICSHAETYDKALEMLVHTPLCIPAIFTLTGANGEGCIIERLEKQAYTRPLIKESICTANHWVAMPTAKKWRPREPDSYGRKGTMELLLQLPQGDDFTWLKAPILNNYTRMAAILNAQTGTLNVIGFEGGAACTHIFSL